MKETLNKICSKKIKYKKFIFRCKAFNLLEASFALLLIGMLSSALIPYHKALNTKQNLELTRLRANYIRKSIEGYVARYGFLPCASENLSGIEKKGTTCGYIPYKTLGISKTYIYDGFGKPFIFGVNEHLTLEKHNKEPYIIVPITQPAFHNNIFRNKANSQEHLNALLKQHSKNNPTEVADTNEMWPAPKLGVHFCRIPLYMKKINQEGYELTDIDGKLRPLDQIAIIQIDTLVNDDIVINHRGKNIETIKNKIFKLHLEPKDYVDTIENQASKVYMSTAFENKTKMPHLESKKPNDNHIRDLDRTGIVSDFFHTHFKRPSTNKGYAPPKPIYSSFNNNDEEIRKRTTKTVELNNVNLDLMKNEKEAYENLKTLRAQQAKQSLEIIHLEPYYEINDVIAWFIICGKDANKYLEKGIKKKVLYLSSKTILFYQTRFNLAGQLNHPCSSIAQTAQRVYKKATRHYYDAKDFNFETGTSDTSQLTINSSITSHKEFKRKMQDFNQELSSNFYKLNNEPLDAQRYIQPIENWITNYETQLEYMIQKYKNYDNVFNFNSQKYFRKFITHEGGEFTIDFSYYLKPQIESQVDIEYMLHFVGAMYLVHYVSGNTFDETDLDEAFKKIEEQFRMNLKNEN